MDRTFIDRRASESENRRARDVAQAVLVGRTTVLEAVRELFSLAHTDAIAEVEDRRFIIGIESETDHLPVGEVRKLWAPSALKEKDVEISRAEERYKTDFLETCRRIANPNCSVDEDTDAYAETSLPRQRARSSSYVPFESRWLILCPIQPTAGKACSLQTAHQIGHFAGGVPDDPRFVIRDHA